MSSSTPFAAEGIRGQATDSRSMRKEGYVHYLIEKKRLSWGSSTCTCLEEEEDAFSLVAFNKVRYFGK